MRSINEIGLLRENADRSLSLSGAGAPSDASERFQALLDQHGANDGAPSLARGSGDPQQPAPAGGASAALTASADERKREETGAAASQTQSNSSAAAKSLIPNDTQIKVAVVNGIETANGPTTKPTVALKITGYSPSTGWGLGFEGKITFRPIATQDEKAVQSEQAAAQSAEIANSVPASDTAIPEERQSILSRWLSRVEKLSIGWVFIVTNSEGRRIAVTPGFEYNLEKGAINPTLSAGTKQSGNEALDATSVSGKVNYKDLSKAATLKEALGTIEASAGRDAATGLEAPLPIVDGVATLAGNFTVKTPASDLGGTVERTGSTAAALGAGVYLGGKAAAAIHKYDGSLSPENQKALENLWGGTVGVLGGAAVRQFAAGIPYAVKAAGEWAASNPRTAPAAQAAAPYVQAVGKVADDVANTGLGKAIGTGISGAVKFAASRLGGSILGGFAAAGSDLIDAGSSLWHGDFSGAANSLAKGAIRGGLTGGGAFGGIVGGALVGGGLGGALGGVAGGTAGNYVADKIIQRLGLEKTPPAEGSNAKASPNAGDNQRRPETPQTVRPQAEPARPQAEPARPQAEPAKPQAAPATPQPAPAKPQPAAPSAPGASQYKAPSIPQIPLTIPSLQSSPFVPEAPEYSPVTPSIPSVGGYTGLGSGYSGFSGYNGLGSGLSGLGSSGTSGLSGGGLGEEEDFEIDEDDDFGIGGEENFAPGGVTPGIEGLGDALVS